MKRGWIGVDLDGTLAHYDTWRGATHVGKPIPAMVERVKQWLEEGKDVRIFTARVSDGLLSTEYAIKEWCHKVFGQMLPVTNSKDYEMIELWDDRAVGVVMNTGEIIGDPVKKKWEPISAGGCAPPVLASVQG